MKKIISIICTILLTATSCFAEKTKENEVAFSYAEYIFSQIGTGNFTEKDAKDISELTPFLTVEQREEFYSENERLGIGPFLLNLLIGFGAGSFRQGDKAIATLQFWGDFVGWGLMIPGMIVSQNAAKDADVEAAKTGTTLTTIGSLVTLAVAIPALIRPWTFANNRNERLRKALKVGNSGKALTDISFAPVLDPITNQYGLVASLKL
ncbi:MAG: P13 family porin [Treponema sp.]|nr:P13 family porin [Treponema sp.]